MPRVGSSSGPGGANEPSTSGSTAGSGSSTSTEGSTDQAEFRKYALLGDLAAKQQNHAQAAEAYQKALNHLKAPKDSSSKLEYIEVLTKLARSLIALGKLQEGEAVVQSIVKAGDVLAISKGAGKPADAKAEMVLPGKLIISVKKSLLDAIGTGAVSASDIHKGASVEHLTFDKPASAGKP
jgi:hypothetical protein